MSNEYAGQIFPVNSLREDPNLRGSYPLVDFSVSFDVTLVAGTVELDNIPCQIAAADAIGVVLYTNQDDVEKVYAATVSAGTASGVKLTFVSTDIADTADLSGTAFIRGRISPTDPS